MAKNKMVNVVNDLMVDLSPENFIVKEGKGKKAKVNEAATAMAMLTNISYYRGLFDAFDAVSDNVEGLDEATADHKKAFDTLFAHATENYEDVATALADASIEAFGDEDEDAEDPITIIAEMDRDDAKAVAKALGVKVVKSDTSETLADKIAEEAEEEDIINTLTELGYYGDAESEDEEDDDEEPEEEEAEDETPEYADMSLGELRKLCKSEGIRYTPKEKAEDLVAKLDEFYAEESDEEEEEPEDEGDDETEEMDYSEMSLSDLRAECKERGIKYTPKDKSDALIAKLEADDAENGSDDEELEEEEAEDESNGYSEMSLGELRKECKARGIKYTPKDKEDALIAKLEEDDGAGSDDDEEEAAEEGDDVDEKELDEILDEEFEDEVLEQEKKAAGKSGKKGGKKR